MKYIIAVIQPHRLDPVREALAGIGVRGLTVSPRFFLLLIPLAAIAAASAVQASVSLLAHRSPLGRPGLIATMAVAGLLLAIAAGRSLPYYYRTPKQPYRAAIRYAEARYAPGRIIVVSNATGGIQYYLRRLGSADSTRFAYVRSAATFDSLVARSPGAAQAVTTFSRALAIELPDIDRRLASQWQRDTTFAATVGDGEITVWSRRPASHADSPGTGELPPAESRGPLSTQAQESR